MQPTVANLRPLSLLRGGEASIADFESEAQRALRLSIWLKPGAYLMSAAAVCDSGLAFASIGATADGPVFWLAISWAAIAIAILAIGQAAWLHAGPNDVKAAGSNPDAEWRHALALLASGELACWRTIDDELDQRNLRRVSLAVFSRPFGILLFSPSGLQRWLGDRSVYASSRHAYFYDHSEWRLTRRRLPTVLPEASEAGQSPVASLCRVGIETDGVNDWSGHPKLAEWSSWLFVPAERFEAIIGLAYPDGFTAARVCKPRLALMTAHRMLNEHGPGIAIDILTAEVRTTIWRQGFVDNALTNSARRGDIADKGTSKIKPADDWIASALRGTNTAIETALSNAESQLISEGRLSSRS
jgi:hypothetical protein